jgi:hypothetical protein
VLQGRLDVSFPVSGPRVVFAASKAEPATALSLRSLSQASGTGGVGNEYLSCSGLNAQCTIACKLRLVHVPVNGLQANTTTLFYRATGSVRSCCGVACWCLWLAVAPGLRRHVLGPCFAGCDNCLVAAVRVSKCHVCCVVPF